VEEVDRPLAGPALTTMGGLWLLAIGLLAYSPSSPMFAPSVSVPERALLFLLVGPGLGPLVVALGLVSFAWPRYRILTGAFGIPLALLGFFVGPLGLLGGPILALAGAMLSIAFESKTLGALEDDERGAVGWIRQRYGLVPALYAVLGVTLAVAAPTALSVNCPPSPTLPTGPSIAVACYGPTLWVLFLLAAIFSAPMAFRLRALAIDRPLPT